MHSAGAFHRLSVFIFFLGFIGVFFSSTAYAVKHADFKTCDQSGFCKRNRAFADDVNAKASSWKSPYHIDNAFKVKDGSLTGMIRKDITNADGNPAVVEFPIEIDFLKSGVVRVRIDEQQRLKGRIELRHGSKARKERYNEAAQYALVGGLEPGSPEVSTEGDQTSVKYGPDNSYLAIIRHNPFNIDFVRGQQTHVQLNSHGLMNLEQWRPKIDKPVEEAKEGEEKQEQEPAGEDESTWWDESFGGNTDSKPRGPESVAMDITFPGYEHIYGIPSHATSLALKTTRGGSGYTDPFRMYNSDVFEYIVDSPMTLYGSIPFMQAHRKDSTVGVFWLNAAETWVDITQPKASTNPMTLRGAKVDTQTHWISEGGILDVFVFLGPTPKDVMTDYAALTGTTTLPQYFATAYHQCRWNYITDEDVKDVDRRFDKYNIPYDIIWLDLEYTDDRKYFTWEPLSFPNPLGMQKQLEEHERKLVTLIDPHIKSVSGYHVSEQLKSKDLAVKNKDGGIYDGWCWPGSSNWIDCFNPAARKWWQTMFTYANFVGSTAITFIWNDMNEPSVFNGPETTMPKDNMHFGGWEHRDVHNLNGMTFHNATYEALAVRDKVPKRPFVLTRAFFAGSQRSAAMWTGDNQADWAHLQASIPMVLSQNIAGFPFAGADIGGFFGNPSKELLTRWYQAGIFYPFMRAHAHIDTRRREPYLAGEPYTGIMAQAVRLRYALLPAWYTAFHTASVDGSPIVRPNWYVHPSDEKGFAIDDQLYLGDTGLLAKPVTAEGAETTEVYLGDAEPYYDYFDFTKISGAGKSHKVSAPLDKIPLFMRGGHVFPRRDRFRRSSGLMRWDPFTLVVVLGSSGDAAGSLYLDDGETFDYREGAYLHRRFLYDGKKQELRSVDAEEQGGKEGKKAKEYKKKMERVKVERVVVVAAPKAWAKKSEVTVKECGKDKKVGLEWHKAESGKAAWAIVKNPDVMIGSDWSVEFS